MNNFVSVSLNCLNKHWWYRLITDGIGESVIL